MPIPRATSGGTLQGTAYQLIASVAVYWRRSRQRHMWEQLGEERQADFLNDLGLARSDAALLWSETRSPIEQLPRMMAVYGVDDAATLLAGPGVRRDLERVCALCPEKARCQRALDDNPDQQDCRFCPNAFTLEALQPH